MQIWGQRRRRWCAGCWLVGLGLGVFDVSAQEFDHQHAAFAVILQQHVRDGLVDYRSLSADPQPLDHYLDTLDSVSERTFNSWVIPQRLSFLINLHNATVLKMVSDRYPVPSFQRVAGLFRDPWEQPVVRLFGNRLTLRILRDNILRRHYAEPGIHFALVPAAVGAPPLRSEPYVPERLYAQLDDQLARFLADVRNNRIEPDGPRLILSPIFRWYREDFVTRAGSLEVYLRPRLPAGFERDFSIRYHSYDWALNGQAPAQ
jgi:hypothetical protein